VARYVAASCVGVVGLGMSLATAQVVVEPDAAGVANLNDNVFEIALAPPALSTVPIPTPPDLTRYIRDVKAAQVLGKALFWDMQAGSDGVTACASCHWHAGADVRVKNTLAPHGPGTPTSNLFRGANLQLKLADFPFHKIADVTNRDSAVLSDSSEITGSQGVIKRNFVAIRDGNPRDTGTAVADPVFHVGTGNARQVTGRNAPSVINAVFYDRQFWDGRANRYFNGVNPFGDTDPTARVWRYSALGGLEQVRILIDNASLASQAVGPANSEVEMAWHGRSFAAFGRKMLSLKPLAIQFVAVDDSLLGPYATHRVKGLNSTVSYASLIRQAFQPEWWEAPTPVDGQYTQMEANFSLFWGLAIQMYEATLVSDASPYDRFMAGDATAISDSAKQGLEIFLNQGKCINCHAGPEFAGGTVSQVRPLGTNIVRMIEPLVMQDGGIAIYDAGYYNVANRPTQEDLGVGATGPFGPFSYTRRIQAGANLGDPVPVPAGQRLDVDGSFKTVTLRNITLTGPYFRTGNYATLRSATEFYLRGADFHAVNIQNVAPDINVIGEVVGNETRLQNLLDFMKSLTDPRVEYQRPPFDHPEIIIPHGHLGESAGVALDRRVALPATGARGGARLKTFEEVLADGVPN